MSQTKLVENKIKSHVLCSITFFFENSAVYQICEKCGRAVKVTDDNITRRMRVASSINKATDTLRSVIFIAFPRQKLSIECSSVLSHMHITCLV